MSKPFTILCIDDNDNNLYTLESLLLSLDNTRTLTANSGTKGLEKLLHEPVDLILLDVQMPEMDGFSVAEFVKNNKKTSHIPIIFISAVFTSEEFIKRGYRQGAIDYLAKPIDDNQLLNKISFYLQLLQKQKELENQKNRLQNILDFQDNIVIVFNRETIVQANQTFLDFVGYKSLTGFKKHHRCICDYFVNEKSYLYGNVSDWFDKVLKYADNPPIAIMPYENENHYFAVKLNILDRQKELYVASFTDITKIQLESLEFKREAVHDPLTNIYNRRKLDIELNRLIFISRSYRLELAVLMLDIDHFKKINDDYGHQVGDEVLIELTQRLSKNLREGDILARYGGEEFVAIMVKCSPSEALHKANQLNKIIAEKAFKKIGKLSISIGIASLKAQDDISSIIKRADKGLYLAKTKGRNRVEMVQ
ncbi:MAG: diguanylate cyclase [Gammaproteobacteria bacterium]|nr:diguanylate cyclase [Gammaproteobacteria bacterium]